MLLLNWLPNVPANSLPPACCWESGAKFALEVAADDADLAADLTSRTAAVIVLGTDVGAGSHHGNIAEGLADAGLSED